MTKIIHQIFLKLTDKSMADFGYDKNSNGVSLMDIGICFIMKPQ